MQRKKKEIGKEIKSSLSLFLKIADDDEKEKEEKGGTLLHEGGILIRIRIWFDFRSLQWMNELDVGLIVGMEAELGGI